MEKLSIIIGVRLNQHKLGDSARASEVIHRANQYLAKTLKCEADEARAFQLKEATLWVSVAGAAWSQEVFSVSRVLLEHLQRHYGPKLVQKIKIKSLTRV